MILLRVTTLRGIYLKVKYFVHLVIQIYLFLQKTSRDPPSVMSDEGDAMEEEPNRSGQYIFFVRFRNFHFIYIIRFYFIVYVCLQILLNAVIILSIRSIDFILFYPHASKARRYKFHPHLLSLSHMQKQSHMDGGQLKNVRLSVRCLSVCLSVMSPDSGYPAKKERSFQF
jgi:hypothetical protein